MEKLTLKEIEQVRLHIDLLSKSVGLKPETLHDIGIALSKAYNDVTKSA